jgi:hypothetical protein
MNTEPDYIAASTGIKSPHRVTLQAGMWICRFASSVNPDGKPTQPGTLHHSP